MRHLPHFSFSCLFLLMTCLAAFGETDPNDEKLLRLETHLDRIRQEVKFSRELSGGSFLVSGGLVGVGGVALSQFALRDTLPGGNDVRTIASMLSLVAGASLAVPGVLVLLWKSDYETLPEKFAAREVSDQDSKMQKVIFGELALQELSDKARSGRLMSSGILGSMGVAALAYHFLVEANTPTPQYGSSHYSSGYNPTATTQSSYLYLGLVYVGTAVVSAFLESTPERENQSYLNWERKAS